jgi:hypothetical protein
VGRTGYTAGRELPVPAVCNKIKLNLRFIPWERAHEESSSWKRSYRRSRYKWRLVSTPHFLAFMKRLARTNLIPEQPNQTSRSSGSPFCFACRTSMFKVGSHAGYRGWVFLQISSNVNQDFVYDLTDKSRLIPSISFIIHCSCLVIRRPCYRTWTDCAGNSAWLLWTFWFHKSGDFLDYLGDC